MPSVNVVNGKQIVVEDLGPCERAVRFLAKPFAQMWHHQDLIQAILRREVSERFKGSAAGWVWAVVAPLLAIAVYTFAFTTNLQAADGRQHRRAERRLRAVHLQRHHRLQFLVGDGVPRADAAARVRALHQADDLPQRHAGGDLDPAGDALYRLISIAVMLLFQLVVTGGLPWTVLLHAASSSCRSWRSWSACRGSCARSAPSRATPAT